MRRDNRLEAITLIGIVIGGRCPGVVCPGSQLSQKDIIQVKLSGGNFPRRELYGGNCPGVIVRGEIVLVGNCPGENVYETFVLGVNCLGGNCLGNNCPGGNCPGGIALFAFILQGYGWTLLPSQNRCFWKFSKIHRKRTMLETLFNKVAHVLSYDLCEIFYTYFPNYRQNQTTLLGNWYFQDTFRSLAIIFSQSPKIIIWMNCAFP